MRDILSEPKILRLVFTKCYILSKDDIEQRLFNLKEAFWFCVTSLTPQGGGEAPKNVSGQIAAAAWWLFGFVVIASYTANLAAFLTISRIQNPIRGLDDLYNQYKIKWVELY